MSNRHKSPNKRGLQSILKDDSLIILSGMEVALKLPAISLIGSWFRCETTLFYQSTKSEAPSVSKEQSQVANLYSIAEASRTSSEQS